MEQQYTYVVEQWPDLYGRPCYRRRRVPHSPKAEPVMTEQEAQEYHARQLEHLVTTLQRIYQPKETP